MNKIINNFFLTGDKYMPLLHLRQPGFTYSVCGPFTKHHERIKKFRESSNLKHLYRNKLGKSCFAHDAAYSDSKYLAEGTISDKVLKGRANEIAKDPKEDGYQTALANMVYKLFDKKTESGTSVNEELAAELHKCVPKKFKRRIVYPRFKDNIWAADLAEMGSLFSKNRNVICDRHFHKICLG